MSDLVLCKRCGRRLKSTAFRRDRRAKSGLRQPCKECLDGIEINSGLEALALPEFDGSSQWVINAGAALISALARDPANRDVQSASRAFGAVASAIRGYMQRADLEKQVSELREQVAEMLSAAKHGQTFASAADFRAAKSDESRPPVH